MIETVKKRRRWPWVLLGLLLVFGAPLAWRLRPLDATERWLLGTWRFGDTTRKAWVELTLTADRHYRFRWLGEVHCDERGRWHMDGEHLQMIADMPLNEYVRLSWTQRRPASPRVMTMKILSTSPPSIGSRLESYFRAEPTPDR